MYDRHAKYLEGIHPIFEHGILLIVGNIPGNQLMSFILRILKPHISLIRSKTKVVKQQRSFLNAVTQACTGGCLSMSIF